MNISAKCWNSMNLPPEERISKKAFKSNSTACVAWEMNLDNSAKGRDIFTYANTKSTLHPSIHTHTLYAFYCIIWYVMFNWRAALCFPKCAVAGVNVGLPLSATENLSNLQIWQTRDMISKWPGQQQQQPKQRSVRVRGACNQKMSFCWHFPSLALHGTVQTAAGRGWQWGYRHGPIKSLTFTQSVALLAMNCYLHLTDWMGRAWRWKFHYSRFECRHKLWTHCCLINSFFGLLDDSQVRQRL